MDLSLFEWCLREDMNARAVRRMAVVDPIEVELTNWPAGELEWIDAPDFPADVGLPGSRQVPMSGTLLLDRADFALVPPKGFHRLVPGGEVRLRYGYVIRCDEVVQDDAGKVTKLRCTVDRSTRGRPPEGRRVKGVVHWVSAAHAVTATLNLIEPLFTVAEPGADGRDMIDVLNPDALVVRTAYVEPSITADQPGVRYQFERLGYVYRAPEDAAHGLVFHRIVGLKDVGFEEETAAVPAAEVAAVVDPNASPEKQAEIRRAARQERCSKDGDVAAFLGAHFNGDLDDDGAWTVSTDVRWRALFLGASAVAKSASVATWISNFLAPAAPAGALPFDAAAFGKLVALVDAGTLSSALGKKVLGELLAKGGDPADIATANGWVQVSDAGALESAVDEVLAAQADAVARYRGGEQRLLGFLIGQAMQATKGRGNPGLIRDIVLRKLG